ncbi:hypothetical protein IWX90DRAFT_189463 [Phyllosticta citrichinensis]|uniref:Uncharacterized protein n=1 Tax=Phyllosticta citrichinensis TaxID=1130410 RepID=A0ABR1XWR9_9PEZI
MNIVLIPFVPQSSVLSPQPSILQRASARDANDDVQEPGRLCVVIPRPCRFVHYIERRDPRFVKIHRFLAGVRCSHRQRSLSMWRSIKSLDGPFGPTPHRSVDTFVDHALGAHKAFTGAPLGVARVSWCCQRYAAFVCAGTVVLAEWIRQSSNLGLRNRLRIHNTNRPHGEIVGSPSPPHPDGRHLHGTPPNIVPRAHLPRARKPRGSGFNMA